MKIEITSNDAVIDRINKRQYSGHDDEAWDLRVWVDKRDKIVYEH